MSIIKVINDTTYTSVFPPKDGNGAPPPFNFKVYTEKQHWLNIVNQTSCTTDANTATCIITRNDIIITIYYNILVTSIRNRY